MAYLMKSPRRWDGFSSTPTVLHSSGPSLWSGAEFQEIRAPRSGVFDSVPRDLTVVLTLDPLKVRPKGRASFTQVPRCPRVLMPERSQNGEWEGAARSLLLFVPESLMEATLHDVAREPSSNTLARHAAPIEYLLNVLRFDVSSHSLAGPSLGEAAITQILHCLFPDDDRIAATERRSDSGRVIGRVCELIEARLSEHLSLVELARMSGMSTRHLCRAFRAATGCAPYEYILRRRVERARELISAGQGSLSETAFEVGFSSHAHMTTTFQKLLGVVPSHFRNRRSNIDPDES